MPPSRPASPRWCCSTVDPAYEAAHHWVDAVLWMCLVYFVFEWLVRLRHWREQGGYALYTPFQPRGSSTRSVPLPCRSRCSSASSPETAWLLGILWVLKVVPGIPGAAPAAPRAGAGIRARC